MRKTEAIKSNPYWWDIAGKPQSPETTPLPRQVEILIVGAGLTGLSAARTLSRAGRSVLVVDGLAPGMGASSRNGGMLGGGHRVQLDVLLAKFGKDISVRLLKEMHIDSTMFAKQIMEEDGIDCDYSETGRFQTFWRHSEYESKGRMLNELQRLVPVEAELIPKSRVHEDVATDIYEGGIVYNLHGGLNPAKWVAGLNCSARRYGAIVQSDTVVNSVNRQENAFVVATSRGSIEAKQVLLATNGYTSSAVGRISRKVFPIPSFIIVTEELGQDVVKKLFPNGRMIVESRVRHCYYRPSPDGTRIVFGGRAAMFKPTDGFFESQLRSLMSQIFPELKKVRLTHRWWGKTGFTFELMPHLGQIDGVWYAMGYCGNGNGMAPWLGHKAAMQMLGDPEGESAFSEIDMSVRWYYRNVPWFLPLIDVKYRFLDVLSHLGKHSS